MRKEKIKTMMMVAAFKNFFPTIKLDIERWKFNEEAQLYVSNKGRIRKKNGTLIEFKVRNDNGYICVYTKESGFWSVHQLVAQTWIPNDDPKKNSVDHLDHNKRNNRVDNLEWCTVAENHARAKRDLCYSPEEADRLINKYNVENTRLKKENAKLRNEAAQAKPTSKEEELLATMIERMSDKPIVKCNGIPITQREWDLIVMSCKIGAKYKKRFENFINGVNPNSTVFISGMEFTRI